MRLVLGMMVMALSAVALAQTKGGAWSFERRIDKITDEVRCTINSPRGKKVLISFQENGVAYLVAGEPAVLLGSGPFVARVDKNAPIEMYSHYVVPLTIRVDRNDDWMAQMSDGRQLVVRSVSDRSAVEEEFSLRGFKEALAAYKRCQAG